MRPSPAFFIALLALGPVACDNEPDDTGGPGPDDTSPGDTGHPDTSPPVLDEDGDGWFSDEDCDDHDAQVWPGAPEACDGRDNDCDGSVDEDFDHDGDGYVVETCLDGDDCDDEDPKIHPGAPEIPYDGIDQDCAGGDLEDVDGDGFRATEVGGNDCDDTNPDINPRAEEIPANGIDEDCSGGDDIDRDDDGYGDVALGGDDCDDGDPSVHPGARDVWMHDGVDSDCDGEEPGLWQLDEAPILIDGAAGYQDYMGRGLDACDFDEDGLDDLLVGCPFGPAISYHGQIGIFYGSGSGSWTTGMGMSDADTVIEGDGYDFIGINPRCGDIDGDGHADVVFERGEINLSPYVTTFGILIYYGNGRGFPARLGEALANAELTMAIGVASGASVVTAPEFTLGDIDGDGADDIVLEWPYTTLHGDAEIVVLPGGTYTGSLTLSDHLVDWWSPDQPMTADYTYQQVLVLEDIDGDGLDDVFAGEPYWSETAGGGTWEGQASFLSGVEDAAGASLADIAYAQLAGGIAGLQFGYWATSGDFDADGVSDGVISAFGDATGATGGGGLWLWSDLATVLAEPPASPTDAAEAHVYGSTTSGQFGYRLDPTGDVDGDGYPDLLVSEPYGGDAAQGRVWVLSGALLTGESEVEDVALWGCEGTNTDNFIGAYLLGGADFDGDGTPDIVLTALYWDTADSSTIRSGRVAIWLSSDA